MHTNQRFRWVLPLLVFITGVFYLLNPTVDKTIKSLWWVLTPLALVLTVFRIYLIVKEKNKKG